jgi:hypothetical protein
LPSWHHFSHVTQGASRGKQSSSRKIHFAGNMALLKRERKRWWRCFLSSLTVHSCSCGMRSMFSWLVRLPVLAPLAYVDGRRVQVEASTCPCLGLVGDSGALRIILGSALGLGLRRHSLPLVGALKAVWLAARACIYDIRNAEPARRYEHC